MPKYIEKFEGEIAARFQKLGLQTRFVSSQLYNELRGGSTVPPTKSEPVDLIRYDL